MAAITIDTDVLVACRDGVSLASTVFRPQGPGGYPVVLVRTPYDRTTHASVSLQVHAVALATAGYAVVLQDVRGRGSSGGSFYPFVNEQSDGLDTIDWLLSQPWCDGSIGLAGVSYNAFTQMAITTANHEAVKCWVPGLAASDVRTSWIRRNGLLDLGFHLSWGLGALAPMDRRTADPEFSLAAHDEPVTTAARGPADQPELASTEAGDWFFDWVASADPYPDMPQVPGREGISSIRAPALVVAGWFDVFSWGSFELLSWLREGAAGAGHRLVAGPWDHSGLPLGRRAGDRDFGRKAVRDLHQLQIEWFDQHLRDGDEVVDDRFFVTGSNTWSESETWPPATGTVEIPFGASGLNGESTGVVEVVEQTPLLGGTSFPWEPELRSGSYDQRSRRARQDVIALTGPQLAEPLVIAGIPRVNLELKSPDPTPVHVTLVDVTAEGPAWNIAEGMAFLEASNGVSTIDLGPIAHRFAAGSSIGVDIAFSAGARLGPVTPGTRTVDLSPSGAGGLSLPVVT